MNTLILAFMFIVCVAIGSTAVLDTRAAERVVRDDHDDHDDDDHFDEGDDGYYSFECEDDDYEDCLFKNPGDIKVCCPVCKEKCDIGTCLEC